MLPSEINAIKTIHCLPTYSLDVLTISGSNNPISRSWFLLIILHPFYLEQQPCAGVELWDIFLKDTKYGVIETLKLVPLEKLWKTNLTMSNVGQNSTYASCLPTLSVIKYYLILICLYRLLLDHFMFFSRLLALWLSWYMVILYIF